MTAEGPTPSWPLAARPDLVEDVVRRMSARPSRAQLLSGGTGVGKTTLARAIVAAVQCGGRVVVPIIGVAELQGVPAAALAPVLTTNVGDDDESITIGDRVHRFVATVGAGASRYVLAVDDVSLVDDVTAGVVYQLVRVFGVPAVFTDRVERALSATVARLDAEGLLDRVEVPPLAPAQVVALAEEYLGDPLHPDAARRLADASAGNPLVLRELLMTASREGRVHPTPVGLDIEEVRLAPHVLDSARAHLAPLSPSERELAELLALAQPWTVDLASAIDDRALRNLVSRAVVRETVDAGRRRVRLAHPLLTEALLADLDPERRIQLVRRAAEALRSTGDQDDRRTAIHLLPEGDADAAELEWAAQAAASAGDPETALRLADAADRLRPTAVAALVRAVALSALDRAADAAFVAASDRADSDEVRAIVALRHGQHLAYRRRDPHAAADLARGVIDRIDPEASGALAAEAAKWRAMAGDVASYEPSAVQSSLAQLGGVLTEAMFATMGGSIAQAQAAIDRGRPLADRHRAELPHAESLLALSQFLVFVGSGDIGSARVLAEGRRLDGEADAAGLWTYTLALIALHGGRHDDAFDLARLAVRLLEWRDFTGLVDVARALARTCAAMSGDDASAVRDSSGGPAPTEAKAVLQLAEADAWTAARAGRDDEAVAILRAAVEEGVRQRHHVLAALTASTAIRLGRARDVVDLLESAADAGGAPLCVLLADVARARARGDYARCVDLLPSLRRAGLLGVARRIAEDAGVRAGQGRARTQGRIAAADLAALTSADPLRLPGTGGSVDEMMLSPREWQIARAAAMRRRSREIAAELGLSVRTVDNHLARVYRKLGVSGRDDLATLLDADDPSAAR
ncbi:LuxR C-terminal-related transcriptional regulator [Microbacterium aurantiacum]|uniref:LuxR C-terminal-related transcriptional regulator n=1 Tax=Microbacterium aurantiacum TaxID=162393 RepID=A0AAJ2HB70_9MICO|nr:LuxR C-terminal-related transcriptional regulator [Microbacterium aurantiacum]MDS0244350.1 LuxR C-terminal-related transcriptional regulator [Microbacterium aurantiacum]